MIETFWKPCGITSNDFADYMKVQLQTNKLCYAGRLDPLAQGVMLILTNEHTKNMNHHLTHNKVYRFQMVLGVSTKSQDIAGAVTGLQSVQASQQQICDELAKFVETYTTQQYPLVSSYVVRQGANKKPLWWYDKHGIHVDDIPSKEVKIHNYNVEQVEHYTSDMLCHLALNRLNMIRNEKTRDDLQVDKLMQQYEYIASTELKNHVLSVVTMTLDVSTGFYVRKFCEDFGAHLGVPCCTFDITRLRIYQ